MKPWQFSRSGRRWIGAALTAGAVLLLAAAGAWGQAADSAIPELEGVGITEYLGDVSLALPFSSVMSEDQVDQVCEQLRTAVKSAP